MQLYLGRLPMLKNFNEKLSQEIAARARREQELIKFEVRIYRRPVLGKTVPES